MTKHAQLHIASTHHLTLAHLRDKFSVRMYNFIRLVDGSRRSLAELLFEVSPSYSDNITFLVRPHCEVTHRDLLLDKLQLGNWKCVLGSGVSRISFRGGLKYFWKSGGICNAWREAIRIILAMRLLGGFGGMLPRENF